MSDPKKSDLLARLDTLTPQELKRYLVQELTRKKLGLVWEADLIDRDSALNANMVFPQVNAKLSCLSADSASTGNLIIEGDNFDSLRLLKATHAGKIRVILIDPPYNTGNKDWVYNDDYVNKNDRWRHSKWLEFMYQRMTLARDLLTPDGVILICINDENRARLELLMDEVMPGRRLGSLVWRTKDTGNDLDQRLSHVHEHILVYAAPGFAFNGRPTDRKKFRNPDNDSRGEWSPQPLTKAHSYTVRENTYYPIQDPATGYWYPCDPDSVWRFASEKIIRAKTGDDEAAFAYAIAGLRSDTMDELIRKKLIYFPKCDPDAVMFFKTKADLVAAVSAGKGPMLPKKKTPLLRPDLPDLDFWVGKPIAPGRPSRKEHWSAKPESERLAPLSSWIAGMNEDIGYDEDNLDTPEFIRSARGGVATEEVKRVLGSKVFNHPKPLSLLQALLSQSTRPDDTVLDFFAGSGTTGHAVLALNAEDGGNRKFILCSSTEATPKEPAKNLCRDVCAERMRRVIAGYGKTQGLGGDFAYLTLALIEEADLMFEATAEHAYALLCLRETGSVQLPTATPVWIVSASDNAAIVVCPSGSDDAASEILAMGLARVIVYTDRPDSMRQRLEDAGLSVETHSLETAFRFGQPARTFAAAQLEAV
ncbi:MAG: site-specific DNA-methyltransferase [Candidimonas sp.]|nr:site-specific DNA-methyltransferase [Candidimonas sp.]